MTCANGSGAFVGMTVVLDAMCRAVGDAGEQVAETQALIRAHDDAITVDSVIKMRSFTEWDNTLTNFSSPSAEDGCGSIDRMRKGCGRSNPSWSAVVEYNGEYPIEALIGAEGTIRRWNPDGSYREGYGWVSGAAVIPAQAPGDNESLGRIDFQWEGGGVGDRGFVVMYNASDVQQYPVMPVV